MDFGLHIETTRLEEFLAKLCRFQEQVHKDQKQLASTLETVMKRLDKTEQWAEEQQNTLQQLRESVLSLTERQDALDAFKIGEKIERLDNYQSEVREMQAQLAGFDTKVRHECLARTLAESLLLFSQGYLQTCTIAMGLLWKAPHELPNNTGP